MTKAKKRITREFDQAEQTLLNNEIYLISIDEKGTPFLVNNKYLLLYFKKESAEESAQGFCKLYGDDSIHVIKVEDNMQFFEMMWCYGIPEFIVNGDSNIYNIGTYFKLSKKPKNEAKGLEIIQKQPKKKSASLSKKIVIKEWFSIFSTISLVCGLGFWVVLFIFGAIIKPELKYDFISPLVLILALGGIISGIVAVNGAHKQFVKSEPKTVWGILLSGFGLLIMLISM